MGTWAMWPPGASHPVLTAAQHGRGGALEEEAAQRLWQKGPSRDRMELAGKAGGGLMALKPVPRLWTAPLLQAEARGGPTSA